MVGRSDAYLRSHDVKKVGMPTQRKDVIFSLFLEIPITIRERPSFRMNRRNASAIGVFPFGWSSDANIKRPNYAHRRNVFGCSFSDFRMLYFERPRSVRVKNVGYMRALQNRFGWSDAIGRLFESWKNLKKE